jgi:dihydroorotase
VTFDLLITDGVLVGPEGRGEADVGIIDGKVAAIGSLQPSAAKETFDARGLHLLPGVIDSQVHFREPGLTHKEDLGSGSAGAALGGVTCFFEMPNTDPNTTTAEALAWKVARARATSWVDFAFYVGATQENAAQLGELEQLPGCAGVKVFLGSSTGTLLVDDPVVLERVLRSGVRRVACHSEDEARLQERKPLTAGKSVHFHPEWRDEECAVRSTTALLALSRRVGRKVHVLHVTTAGEVPLLAAAKPLVSCEVTPQHLTLFAPECYDRLGTRAQMNPPIRSRAHHEALWKGVSDGVFDVLGSDHAPHTLEEKARPYPQSPSGMPGVQTLLPVMLNHVAEGKLSLERLVQLTSAGPARVFGLKDKGVIKAGADADLTLVDLKRAHVFTAQEMANKSGWSPFEGMTVQGFPVATLVRGQVVMRDGALLGAPSGQPAGF